MSDWEDFCESQGLNPGCPDDNERFLEMLETPSRMRRQFYEVDYIGEDEQENLVFSTFREAADWSRNNRGKPFTRSADGTHFVPKESYNKTQNKLTGAHAYRNQPLPEGSGWMPGSYPTTNEEEKLFANDCDHERKTFRPLLRKLAPNIAWQADRGNYYSVGSMAYLSKHTLSELKELQALLEERKKRCECWYSTQRAYSLRRIAKRETAGYAKEPWLKKRDQDYKNNSKKPQELVFWETALKSVREEYIRRLEEIDTYQAEAKAMGLEWPDL